MKSFLKNRWVKRKDNGFSLLELVVAVGVLMVLTVGGLFAYDGITDNARKAAVQNAADTVYNQAMIYTTDDNPQTTVHTAAKEWNDSAGIVIPEELAVIKIMGLIGADGKEQVAVIAKDLEGGNFEIQAVYGGTIDSPEIKVVKNSFEIDKNSPNPGGAADNNAEEELPVITAPNDPCFTFSEGTITDYNEVDCSKDVVIPSTINGETVIAIGYNAFINNKLTSVTIPDSVTTIGTNAFNFNQLTSVTIPNSVTTIGGSVFANNQLMTSVTISDNMATIGEGAFSGNQLTSVTIPDGVTTIGEGAFSGNQLTSVTIPNNVTTIGNRAFSGNQLTSVTIPNNVTTIGDQAFASNQLTSVDLGNVEKIGMYAFNNNKLTSVTIPDSVTKIEISVFASNQLTSVDLGEGVKTIGADAFYSNKLTSVTIPDSVTTIGSRAFVLNKQLTSVSVPSSTNVESGAFGSATITRR